MKIKKPAEITIVVMLQQDCDVSYTLLKFN